MYTLEFAPQALEDLSKLKKSEPAAFKKAGKPEPLSGDRIGQWSRRISLKHRLIYEIEETDMFEFTSSDSSPFSA